MSIATSSKIDFTTLGFGNYSTSEVDTGFTWVNGDKIYKKTINFGQMPASGNKAVNHGISGLKYLIKWEGMSTNAAGTTFWTLPIVNTSQVANTAIDVTSTQIVIYVNTDHSGKTAYFTLYYTKNS